MPEIEILTAQRVVTTAGTPEKIKESPENMDAQVIAILITANHDNAGLIYVTYGAARASASTVGRKLTPDKDLLIDVSQFADAWLDLSKIWIDSANDGDGLSYVAFKVIR